MTRSTIALLLASMLAALALPAASHGQDADGCVPELYEQHPGDNTDDASGIGQLFERIDAPGLTDRNLRTATVGFADVDDDGLQDVYMVNNGEGFSLHLNQGCFTFEQTELTIDRPEVEGDDVTWGGIAMAMADFNDDGHPDFYLGTSGGSRSQFLLSQGSYDHYEDHAVRMGVDNTGAYVHGQISIADVNGDGWLDIAVGAEQIANDTAIGRPLSRMYVYEPPAEGGDFTNGSFTDIGGTPQLPDFGGVDPAVCDPQVDKAVSSVLLRDLDGDGDLDLLQGSQADMNPLRTTDPGDDCAPGVWRVGIFAFENQLADTGEFRFRKVAPGPGYGLHDDDMVLAEEGQQVYNYALSRYEPVRRATSAYIMQTSDVDNDGDLDVMSVVSTDPEWNAQSERLGGKFWRNDGDWLFAAATDEHGLEPLRWTYHEWGENWDAEMQPSAIAVAFCAWSSQRSECAPMELEDHTFMSGGLVAADLDNDGWQDLVYFDRHELDRNWGFNRNALILNDGDGTFRAVPTTESGLSENMLAGEAVDLNGDGRLEIFSIARNSGSGQLPVIGAPDPDTPEDQDNDRVYWNAGPQGDQHWLTVRLDGLPERQLIGSVVEVFDRRTGELLQRRDYTTVESYKATHEPWAHFGLGAGDGPVGVRVRLPSGGDVVEFAHVGIDQSVVLDVSRAPGGRQG